MTKSGPRVFRMPKWKKETLTKLLKEGLDGVVIAERLGLSDGCVSKYKQKLKEEGKL